MPIMVDRFKLNSLTLHYAYFILTPMIVSVVFYLSAHHDDLHYIDALFMCFCAITGTGLNVVRPRMKRSK
jgi:aminopeptidase-like protein